MVEPRILIQEVMQVLIAYSHSLDVYSTIMTTNISSNSMFDMMDLHACQNHTAMQHFLLYH